MWYCLISEVESRTQSLRDRPKAQKNLRPRAERASVLQKKIDLRAKISQIFREIQTFKKGLHKFSARFLACSKTKKRNGHDLGPVVNKSKNSAVFGRGQAFSRTCRLQDQGLQNVSSRTPPVINIL